MNHIFLVHIAKDKNFLQLTTENIFTKIDALDDHLVNVSFDALREAIKILLKLKELYRIHDMRRKSMRRLMIEGFVCEYEVSVLENALKTTNLLRTLFKF